MTAGHGELRARARRGVLLVSLRGIALRLVGLLGTVALARLLAPSEFGQVALAIALISTGRFLVDAGLGAALIRSPEEPSREDLACCSALQLLVGVLLVAGCLVGAAFGGPVARLTAIASLSLPLIALRSTPTIRLERDLEFRPVLAAEMVDAMSSMVLAVALVRVGAGAGGVAVGFVMGALVGTLTLLVLARGMWVRPRLNLTSLRRLLPLGLAQQSLGGLNVLRDQGVNVGVFVIAGAPALGIWTIAYRMLQVPFLLFEGLWRVSFPAMARLVGQRADVRPVLEKGVAIAGVGTGLLVSALVGCAPSMLPALLGARWSDAALVLPAAGISLVVGGPISAAGTGFLLAIGDVRSVVRATVVHTACWLCIGLSLLPMVGVVAVSLGWLAGGVAETVIFARALFRHTGARLGRIVVRSAVPAVLGGGAGWWLAEVGRPSILRGTGAALFALGVFVVSALAVDRSHLRAAMRELRGSSYST